MNRLAVGFFGCWSLPLCRYIARSAGRSADGGQGGHAVGPWRRSKRCWSGCSSRRRKC
jgi:hypothetical protein